MSGAQEEYGPRFTFSAGVIDGQSDLVIPSEERKTEGRNRGRSRFPDLELELVRKKIKRPPRRYCGQLSQCEKQYFKGE